MPNRENISLITLLVPLPREGPYCLLPRLILVAELYFCGGANVILLVHKPREDSETTGIEKAARSHPH
jgi:hypothetical protein